MGGATAKAHADEAAASARLLGFEKAVRRLKGPWAGLGQLGLGGVFLFSFNFIVPIPVVVLIPPLESLSLSSDADAVTVSGTATVASFESPLKASIVVVIVDNICFVTFYALKL